MGPMIGQGKPALFKFGVARVVVMALGCKGARLQEQLVQFNGWLLRARVAAVRL